MKRFVVVALLAGCEGAFNPKDGEVKVFDPDVAVDATPPNLNPATPTTPSGPSTPMPPARTCAMGRSYVGFGGTPLEADREQGEVGEERRRPKPFSALSTDYVRVLGNTPAMLAGAESTFGSVPARWDTDVTMSAVSVYTAFRIAFQGCLTLTAQPTKYGTAPTDATARAECTAWAERFWSRRPLAPEVSACTDVVMRDSTTETSARRRWAYGCATTLTSSGFLTF
jgi:hypothetical protein